MPRVLTIPGPAASGVVDGSGGRVVYWAFRETSGAATATFRLWDSSNAAGTMLTPFQLAAGESIREFPGFHTLPYRVGLFLEVISGAIEGSISVLPWADEDDAGGVPVYIVGGVNIEFNEMGGGG